MHITYTATDGYKYDYDAIETALVKLGATEQEADALTDVLHEEGWGGVEDTQDDADFSDETLTHMLAWLRENRPVDPRATWDDSDYIEIIESAKQDWCANSPCTTPLDDDSDASINRELFDNAAGCFHARGLDGELHNTSDADIRADVQRGLDRWYGAVDASAVEHYDKLDAAARAEYRENTLVGDARDGDTISRATAEQLDAIDAGRKAPCLS